MVAAAPSRPWRRRVRRTRYTSLVLLAAAAAACPVALWLGGESLGFVGTTATQVRRTSSLLHGSRWTARAAAGTEGDEFKAARDRIRRIQLGLGPNEPLPEDEAEAAEEEAVVPQEGKKKGDLNLAEAGAPAEPVVAPVTGDTETKDEANAEEQPLPAVADAYAGSLKDVKELKPESTKPKGGPNFVEGLLVEAGLVTLPTPGEVFQTFGTVLLLVALYTGFVAVVDLSAQKTLGQVFEDFYKAARPEAPSM